MSKQLPNKIRIIGYSDSGNIEKNTHVIDAIFEHSLSFTQHGYINLGVSDIIKECLKDSDIIEIRKV